MARTIEISVNMAGWNRMTRRVTTQANAINGKIEADAELTKNYFTNLPNFIKRINEMETLITRFVAVINQEVSNMNQAATLMQQRD